MRAQDNNKEVFGLYSEYYDLLYKDKDYTSEASYVIKLIREHLPNAKTIADFGCGTALHGIEFAKKGFSVAGIELSESMCGIAVRNISESRMKKKVEIHNGDISTYSIGKKFDAVVSLFHVMSYLTDNEQLSGCIKNAARHLKKNGLFMFDFWYGPCVLTVRPSKRRKVLEGNGLKIIRSAVPVMEYNENVVEVNYAMRGTRLQGKKKFELCEKHRMRYFFLPELKYMCETNGFRILNAVEWMTGRELDETTWSGVCVLQFTGMKK
ncbi:MAG: class I SAM-dependent methyltransferase [Ignavibacteria bacterium]|nr:class I SAM-dependent methyltransferase [Ignavibacteria bacterium]